MDDTVTFLSPALTSDHGVFVISLQGREALGDFYEYTLVLQRAADETTDPTALLGADATVMLDAAAGTGIHGIVRQVELLASEAGVPEQWRVALVPRVWRLGQTLRSRVFLDVTVGDLARRVLTAAGFVERVDFDLRIQGEHPRRGFVVQYQETDADFLTRWLARDGVTLFFAQGTDHETLVLTDANRLFDAAATPTVAYVPQASFSTAVGAVTSVSQRATVIPRVVVLRDYNPSLPASVVTNVTPAAVAPDLWTGTHSGQQVIYGEHLDGVADANRRASLRAESLVVQRDVTTATCNVCALAAGQVFTLTGPPQPQLAREYLVVCRETALDQAPTAGTLQPFTSTLTLTPSAVPYRPTTSVPWPVVHGLIPAVIDGNLQGVVAPVDEHGCYRVVFAYDAESRVGTGRASCPVRVGQLLAGPGYGSHFTLHQGAEVWLAHLGGDPDQPVIVAVGPNLREPSPVTAAHNTRSLLVSRAKVSVEIDDHA